MSNSESGQTGSAGANTAPQAAIIESFPVGPLQCNCCVIGDPVSRKAIVVDPGGDVQKILQVLEKHQLQLVDIIHTHAHLDHILAAGELKEVTGATIHLHKDDKFLWDIVEQQCQMFGVPPVTLPEPDQWLQDDQALACCGGVAMHTPGHTPGSVSFWFEQDSLLIAGDTLFKRSIGRTDLPGGDYTQIEKSIRERLYALDDKATVITGHGDSTTIGDEKQQNPFIRV
ncbi:MBL fold metallo-hydrolase [bacterium]|nr:MBL fold metallo-hydrolase [bacterium]